MPLFGSPNIAALEAKRDVQGLIKALSSKDATTKIAAADALGPLRDPMAVEPLTALIADDDAAVRRAAVRALTARGGVRVVEPLLVALQDPDESVRSAAMQGVFKRLMTDQDQDARLQTVIGLGKIRPGGAVEPLIKAVQDPDEAIRVAAMKSLSAIGDPSAVGPLIAIVAAEQRRAKATGRSSLAAERAASQALDALCTDRAIDALQEALGSADPDVRELAVRRLSRITSPAVADTLVGRLEDADPNLARMAARGLLELRWQPPNDAVAARFWATLREWRRLPAHGQESIPYLAAALPDAPASERTDILRALAELGWQPAEHDEMAARFWVQQGNWDAAVEVGEPAVPVVEEYLKTAPGWPDRVSAADALVRLGHEETPFARLDVVKRALAILGGDADEETRKAELTTLLAEEKVFEESKRASLGWCDCGYPAARVKKDGSRELLESILGVEVTTADTAYHCPNCGTRQSTVV